MVCTTITVQAALVINSVTATLSIGQDYNTRLDISYSGTGTWRITDNGNLILASGNVTPIFLMLAPGTHQICVEAN